MNDCEGGPAPDPEDATISGHKYDDVNGNGVFDEGDTPLEGWIIELSNGATTTTDSLGEYSFGELPEGSYNVCEQSQEGGWIQTGPNASTTDSVMCDGDGQAEWGFDVGLSQSENVVEFDFLNREESLADICSDGLDNEEDGEPDGWVDLNDSDCNSVKPVITVYKIVDGGDASPEDFVITVSGGSESGETFNGSSDGTAVMLLPGEYSVNEDSLPENYSPEYSEGCEGDLALEDTAECTVTNIFTGSTDDGGGSGDNGQGGIQEDTTTEGGNGPIVGSLGGGGQVLGASTGSGEVLGVEALGCGGDGYLTEYLAIWKNNDPFEVMKLKIFLNAFEGSGLEVNGTFDQATETAVSKFQLRYADEILAPWGLTEATGFVYITTQHKINSLICAALAGIETPPLVPYSR